MRFAFPLAGFPLAVATPAVQGNALLQSFGMAAQIGIHDFERSVGIHPAIQRFVGRFVRLGPFAYRLAFDVAGDQLFRRQLVEPVAWSILREMGVSRTCLFNSQTAHHDQLCFVYTYRKQIDLARMLARVLALRLLDNGPPPAAHTLDAEDAAPGFSAQVLVGGLRVTGRAAGIRAHRLNVQHRATFVPPPPGQEVIQFMPHVTQQGRLSASC